MLVAIEMKVNYTTKNLVSQDIINLTVDDYICDLEVYSVILKHLKCYLSAVRENRRPLNYIRFLADTNNF